MRDWLNVTWYHCRTMGRDLAIAVTIIIGVLFCAFGAALLLTMGRAL